MNLNRNASRCGDRDAARPSVPRPLPGRRLALTTVLAGGIAITGLSAPAPANAQQNNSSGYRIQGSYLNSCHEIRQHFNSGWWVLEARCKSNSGQLGAGTQLSTNPCVGDIFNANGRLACSSGPTPPVGPYRASCTQVWVYGDSLNGECRPAPGLPTSWSKIKYKSCTGPITLVPGTHLLTCEQGQGAIPQGSYRATCSVQRFVDGNLDYVCRRSNGSKVTNTLSTVSECSGDIWNSEGFLKCHRGGQPPPGSYRQSCMAIMRNKDVLQATCKTNKGTNVWAELQGIAACGSADIRNDDGKLMCGSPPPPPQRAPR